MKIGAMFLFGFIVSALILSVGHALFDYALDGVGLFLSSLITGGVTATIAANN